MNEREIQHVALHGPAKLIWGYGFVFGGLFVVIAFVYIAVAFIDRMFADLTPYWVVGLYGATHLFVNSRFRFGESWARWALVGFYALWALLAILNLFSGRGGEAWFETAVAVLVLSAGMVALLLRLK